MTSARRRGGRGGDPGSGSRGSVAAGRRRARAGGGRAAVQEARHGPHGPGAGDPGVAAGLVRACGAPTGAVGGALHRARDRRRARSARAAARLRPRAVRRRVPGRGEGHARGSGCACAVAAHAGAAPGVRGALPARPRGARGPPALPEWPADAREPDLGVRVRVAQARADAAAGQPGPAASHGGLPERAGRAETCKCSSRRSPCRGPRTSRRHGWPTRPAWK